MPQRSGGAETKMKKALILLALTVALAVCFGTLVVGCTQGSDSDTDTVQNTGVVELQGNPTTGYTWINTIIPEGVVKEVSTEYTQDEADEGLVGVGGTFVFTFESVSEGEAEIMFSYLREFEDVPALDTAIYKATVDADGNLQLELIQGPSGV